MATSGDDPDWKPLSAAVSVLRHKWTPLILRELLTNGPRRFSELSRFDGLSNKVLSEHLDHLQHAGLVDREEVSQTPVRVRYSLTESGAALSPAIDALETWGRSYRNEN